MIVLKNIYKKYRSNKYVLKDINLNFSEKGLVCILGESGSGKTSLLNIISGLDEPTKGEVYIDRVNINKLIKDNNLYNQYISFIFQNYNLISNLSINDNIMLLKNKKEDTLLKKLKIFNKKNSKVSDLSGGQKQRVAIARALSQNNKIIICDEPTGALDSKNSKTIMEILKKISKTKLVIMVTHNIDIASTYADRIITLKDGVVTSDNNKEEFKIKKSSYKKQHNKISLTQLFKVILKNIKRNLKRNITLGISLSIGIISLLSVLSISYGFNKSLANEEKSTLAQYPILISETSTNLSNDLSNIFETNYYNDNLIHSVEKTHKNIIDNNLIDYIDNNTYTKYILKKYLINNIYLSYINNNVRNEINLLYGNHPTNNNEILLMINEDKTINKYLLEQINLNNETYEYYEIIDKEIFVKRKRYKIVGIANFKKDSYLYEEEGIFIFNDIDEIPLEISLYPKDYNNKLNLLKYLDNYENLEYTDYSYTVKDVTSKLVSGISIILVVFSIITLLVGTLMIYILTTISIYERTNEIGIYKVNGIHPFIIKIMMYLENIIITIISILISVLIIKLISIPINSILYELTGLTKIMNITNNLIFKTNTLMIVLVIISTMIPLRKIDELNIIDTNKNN